MIVVNLEQTGSMSQSHLFVPTIENGEELDSGVLFFFYAKSATTIIHRQGEVLYQIKALLVIRTKF